MEVQSRVHKYALHWLRQTRLAKSHRRFDRLDSNSRLKNVFSRSMKETPHRKENVDRFGKVFFGCDSFSLSFNILLSFI